MPSGCSEDFKFQSDSINTEKRADQTGKPYTLNSNLILLIPGAFRRHNLEKRNFKFQSDSINTGSKRPV